MDRKAIGNRILAVVAHGEWNVLRFVNQRRRDDAKYGIAQQVPIFFDGHALSSAEFEQAVGAGNVGACKT